MKIMLNLHFGMSEWDYVLLENVSINKQAHKTSKD